jgi:hypothetical protein
MKCSVCFHAPLAVPRPVQPKARRDVVSSLAEDKAQRRRKYGRTHDEKNLFRTGSMQDVMQRERIAALHDGTIARLIVTCRNSHGKNGRVGPGIEQKCAEKRKNSHQARKTCRRLLVSKAIRNLSPTQKRDQETPKHQTTPQQQDDEHPCPKHAGTSENGTAAPSIPPPPSLVLPAANSSSASPPYGCRQCGTSAVPGCCRWFFWLGL